MCPGDETPTVLATSSAHSPVGMFGNLTLSDGEILEQTDTQITGRESKKLSANKAK